MILQQHQQFNELASDQPQRFVTNKTPWHLHSNVRVSWFDTAFQLRLIIWRGMEDNSHLLQMPACGIIWTKPKVGESYTATTSQICALACPSITNNVDTVTLNIHDTKPVHSMHQAWSLLELLLQFLYLLKCVYVWDTM